MTFAELVHKKEDRRTRVRKTRSKAHGLYKRGGFVIRGRLVGGYH